LTGFVAAAMWQANRTRHRLTTDELRRARKLFMKILLKVVDES
jgi:hypothetical protein